MALHLPLPNLIPPKMGQILLCIELLWILACYILTQGALLVGFSRGASGRTSKN